MKLTTTLNLLKKADVDENFLSLIGNNLDQNESINLLSILQKISPDYSLKNFFTCFVALEQDWAKVKPILKNIVTNMAESVLYIFEEKYPDDDRPRKAIELAKYEYESCEKFMEPIIKSDALDRALYATAENLINAPEKLKKISKSANAAACALQTIIQVELALRKKTEMEIIMMKTEHSVLRAVFGLNQENLNLEKSDLNELKSAMVAAWQTSEMAKYAVEFEEEHKKQIEIIKKYLTWE